MMRAPSMARMQAAFHLGRARLLVDMLRDSERLRTPTILLQATLNSIAKELQEALTALQR
jgi:hypothetical protein